MREEAARWESRVNELLLKYGSVDLAEHNRVADALKVRRRVRRSYITARLWAALCEVSLDTSLMT